MPTPPKKREKKTQIKMKSLFSFTLFHSFFVKLYRVFHNNRPKITAYCSKDMSMRDFQSLLGAHHLIKYASLFFGCLPMVYTDLEAKDTDIYRITILGVFFIIEGAGFFNPAFLRPNLTKYRCVWIHWKENFLDF